MSDTDRQSRRTLTVMLLLGAALAALLYSLDLPDTRHELASGVLGGTLIAAAVKPILRETWRNACLSAGVLLLGLAAAETYLTVTAPGIDPRTIDHESTGALAQFHPTLGYAPATSKQVQVKRTVKDSPNDVIYDVTYTLDDAGRRIGPNENRSADCVLFFGGSYTWGEGVNDDETMPYQYAMASGHTVRAVNLGFAGYGAHHMLRAIDDGVLTTACTGTVRAVIYTAIPPHYLRSAGMVRWGQKSPRYVLSDAGVVFTGPLFDSMADFAAFHAKRQSAIADRILTLLDTPAALDLYAAVVQAAAERVAAQTTVPFIILYWDLVSPGADPTDDPQLARLLDDGFTPLLVSGFLTRDQMTAMRIPGDGHPTGEAYRLLATALYKDLSPALTDPSVAEARP